MPPKESMTLGEAMKLNRHQRRSLGKQNGIKIPSAKNIKRRIADPKKMDKNFNKLFK